MKKNRDEKILKTLEYIGLNLSEIPETLKLVEDIQFNADVSFDEKKYKQYRYISPKEIEILLSPTNRLDDLKEKYTKASPLASYLDSESDKNVEKHETFLRMLKEVDINEIESTEQEQQELNKKIPFRVRYPENYLWQIYYSQASDKYFMIVPTEDRDYSTFFYVLKKQIEKKKPGKIFVPISNLDYSKELLNKTEIQSLENYLWLFTNDWPSIYEVYDKNDKASIQIVGQTEVYKKIKSEYKVKLSNKIEATKFFKLVKALFILQSELPNYFKFETQIDKQGELEFYFENRLLKYEQLSEWVNTQYMRLLDIQKSSEEENERISGKLEKIKRETIELEREYLNKEKQISTFLECKKSFFGKVKYFFKYNKKTKKAKDKKDERDEKISRNISTNKMEEKIKNQYTLDEVIEKGKKATQIETELKNKKMDINALKLKNVNLSKKIENATAFIEEIDSHKKSIFEFWKYSNKDEVQALAEGEEEVVNVKVRSKVFDYEEDLDEFGILMDTIQREKLNKEQLDSVYLATTNQLEIMNKIKNKSITQEDITKYLKQIKIDLSNEKDISEEDVIDIFGNLAEDTRKIKKLANKSHREQPKNKYYILGISKATKGVEYKTALQNAVDVIKEALEKCELQQDITVYKCTDEDKNIYPNEINIFNLNPEKEIENALKSTELGKVNLFKINVESGVNAIAITNCVYYDNQNKTLPIGMDKDSKIIVKLSDADIQLDSKKVIKVGRIETEDNSKLTVKTINILEYSLKIEE